jgi:hypothetical protein
MLFIYFYTLLQGKIPFAVFYATALIALSGILVISANIKKVSGFHDIRLDKEKIRNFLTLFLITFSIFFIQSLKSPLCKWLVGTI